MSQFGSIGGDSSWCYEDNWNKTSNETKLIAIKGKTVKWTNIL